LTSPLANNSDAQRRNWLLRYLGVQKMYDRKVRSALVKAAQDANRALNKLPDLESGGIGSATKRYQTNLVRYELRDIIRSLYKGFIPVLGQGQQDAAEAAARASLAEDAKVLGALFPDEKVRDMWEGSFIASARHSIGALVNRVTGVSTTYPLSTRVYRTAALSRGLVDTTINNHLARGTSAAELAKAVTKSISPNTPGGVSFAAQRLARTEINNAFHTQSMEEMDKPWVENVKWNLSQMHKPDPGDLCEVYAAEGTFPKDGVPLKPHPQCMCYITPVMMDFNAFAQQLRSGVFDSFYTKSNVA
jgi:hypothetical protein